MVVNTLTEIACKETVGEAFEAAFPRALQKAAVKQPVSMHHCTTLGRISTFHHMSETTAGKKLMVIHPGWAGREPQLRSTRNSSALWLCPLRSYTRLWHMAQNQLQSSHMTPKFFRCINTEKISIQVWTSELDERTCPFSDQGRSVNKTRWTETLTGTAPRPRKMMPRSKRVSPFRNTSLPLHS